MEYEPQVVEILSIMTPEAHKIGLPLAQTITDEWTPSHQFALEWLMVNDWIRLIDIGPLAAAPGLYRVFMAMPVAVEWFKSKRH